PCGVSYLGLDIVGRCGDTREECASADALSFSVTAQRPPTVAEDYRSRHRICNQSDKSKRASVDSLPVHCRPGLGRGGGAHEIAIRAKLIEQILGVDQNLRLLGFAD